MNTLACEASAGDNLVVWDGRSKDGRRVTSGVYFYQIVSDGFTAQRKMLLVP